MLFYTELKYKCIRLDDARSMVMTSFFSHKTITHLDLEISQRTRSYSAWDRYSLLEKSFFCSEESFRNHVAPERRLLYTLNLDFPDGREYSNLRSGPAPASLFGYGFRGYLVGVEDIDYFFSRALIMLMVSAWEQSDCRFKLLKWIADFRPLEASSIFFPKRIQYDSAVILYRECVDSAFAMKCFEKFIELCTFERRGEIEVLEYLLYQAKLCDFDVRSKKSCRLSLTDFSMLSRCIRLVASMLKYENTVYYTENSIGAYETTIFPRIRRRHEDDLRIPENQMSKLRFYRVMQIIHIFKCHEYLRNGGYSERFDLADVSEALRLVWRSIPDCFVSLQEMHDAYQHVLPAEFIDDSHSFYEETIRQTISCREPRTLTHYCRSVIRKSLFDSKQWLPDGIKQLKLPPRFESFLNLQTDHLRPENFQAL